MPINYLKVLNMYDNIRQSLQNNEVNWTNLQKYLESKHTSQKNMKKIESIFNSLDKNQDGSISFDEWDEAANTLSEIDKNQNGHIGRRELKKYEGETVFKDYKARIINKFLKALNKVEKNPQEDIELDDEISTGATVTPTSSQVTTSTAPTSTSVDTSTDVSGSTITTSASETSTSSMGSTSTTSLISPPVTDNPVSDTSSNSVDQKFSIEGDNDGNIVIKNEKGIEFTELLKRLGIEPGSDAYEKIKAANPDAARGNWVISGKGLVIPNEIKDKLNLNGLIDGKSQPATNHDIASELPFQNVPEQQVVESKHSTQQTSQPASSSTTSHKKHTTQTTTPTAASSTTRKSSSTPAAKKPATTGTSATRKPSTTPTTKKPTTTSNTPTQKTSTTTTQKPQKTEKRGFFSGVADTISSVVSSVKKVVKSVVPSFNKTDKKAPVSPDKNKNLSFPPKTPDNIKQVTASLQKTSGGKARVEYNKETKQYTVIQTGVKNKDVKEVRVVLSAEPRKTMPIARKTKIIGQYTAKVSSVIDGIAMVGKSVITADDDALNISQYLVSATVVRHDGKTEKIDNTPKMSEKWDNHKGIHTAVDIQVANFDELPEDGKKFVKTLIEDKQDIMRTLNIDNETYDMLAQSAIGIAGRETQYGEWSLDNKRQVAKDILDDLGLRKTVKEIKGDDSALSMGLTQLKFALHQKDEVINKYFVDFGLEKEDDLKDPAKSALATMAVLKTFNDRLNSDKYREAMGEAEGVKVEYEGWEMGADGVAKKTGNTKAWENHISRQDALCAMWNGGEKLQDLLNGEFKPQGFGYVREVAQYANKFKISDVPGAREAAVEYDVLHKPFEKDSNNGAMGSVVFMPAMYKDSKEIKNTKDEITRLDVALQKKNVDEGLRTKVRTSLENGELAFAYGLTDAEIASMNKYELKLLMNHLDRIKLGISADGSVNFSDGINSAEAETLRKRFSKQITKAEENYKSTYLSNHSRRDVLGAKDAQKVVTLLDNDYGNYDFLDAYGNRRGFQHVTPLGVREGSSAAANVLAQSAFSIVSANKDGSSGQCLTGVKSAFTGAGVDVSGMSTYGNTPKYVDNYFKANSDKFTQVEYVSEGTSAAGTRARKITVSDLRRLPAGYIVVWKPDPNGPYADKEGHIEITNGYGQGYADAPDNMGWADYTSSYGGSGKGEHGTFVVYKLAPGWKVGADGKLYFEG